MRPPPHVLAAAREWHRRRERPGERQWHSDPKHSQGIQGCDLNPEPGPRGSRVEASFKKPLDRAPRAYLRISRQPRCWMLLQLARVGRRPSTCGAGYACTPRVAARHPRLGVLRPRGVAKYPSCERGFGTNPGGHGEHGCVHVDMSARMLSNPDFPGARHTRAALSASTCAALLHHLSGLWRSEAVPGSGVAPARVLHVDEDGAVGELLREVGAIARTACTLWLKFYYGWRAKRGFLHCAMRASS